MVKISFQSVAGQKVEKENDGDKTEILIPHAMVGNAFGPFIFLSMAVIVVCTCYLSYVMPVVTADSAARLACRATCTCTAANSRGVI